MAFKKSLQLNNGFTAEYWRVVSVPSNKLEDKGEVVVVAYKDKATRDNNRTTVARKVYTVDSSSFNFSGDLFEQAYEIIKNKKEHKDLLNPNATAFFSDAEVV